MSIILRQHQHRLFAAGLVPILAVLLTAAAAPRPAEARTGYPKIFGWYLSGTLTQDQIPRIAKYDVLVLDADFPYDNPGELDQIRALNPDIKILAFIASNGTGADAYNRPPETVKHRHWQGINDGGFWLYSVDGSHVEDWPGKWSTNLTPNGPVNAQGEHYWTWFARFVDEAIWQTGQWDGVLLDDVWENISWLNNVITSPIDSDRDGVADPGAQLDAWWKATEDSLTQAVRARLGPSAIVIGNGPSHYYSALNGVIIENYPFNGYSSSLIPALDTWTSLTYSASYSYFNNVNNFRSDPQQVAVVNTFASGSPDAPDTTGRFEAHKRFTLGSTLLSDGYYSLDYDWRLHNSLWWEPEYDLYLGDPDGPAYSYTVGGLSIWRRDYAEASVVVNPNPTALAAQSGLPDIGAWDAYIGPRIVDPPPPDTIPPASTPSYWGHTIDAHSVMLRWKAAGDDGMSGRATSYEIRMSLDQFWSAAEWDAATPVPNSVVPSYPGMWDSLAIGGLQPSTAYYFEVKSVDEAGNKAPLGNYVRLYTADAPAGDTTPPAAIGDLHVVSVDTASAVLAWTAPGDDGTSGTASLYTGRRSLAPLSEANWAAAQPLGGLPAPAPAGSAQSATVTGLAPSTTYYVALKAQDEVPNLSALGNVVSFTTATPPPPPPPPDTTGPAPVTDLAVTGMGETWITLGFTAPADSQGTVGAYDLRYVPGATFDLAQWNGATVAPTEAPLPPGSTESVTVSGLAPGSVYTFRLRSADDSGNPSVPGNPATGTTPVPPDTTGPAAVTDLAASGATQHTLTLTFTAPADQEGTVTAYDLRMTSGTTFPDGSWDGATAVPTGTPRVPGAAETVMVGGLDPGADHAFRIRSVDDSGNWSALGNTASGRTLSLTDTSAPARITDLAAAVVDTYVVVLSWTAPGDDGTTGQASLYDVRWRADTLSAATWSQAAKIAGVPAPNVPGYLEILQIPGLPADQDLALAVRTLDEAGNTSPISNVVTARIVTPQPPDTQPPAPIEGLRADSDPIRVNLAWDAGVEPDLAYYRLYRGRGSSGTAGMLLYRNHLDLPQVTDDQVIPGRDYCYSVTAVDATGNESARSTPLTIRVPFSRFTEPLPPFLEVGDPYPNPTRGGLSLDYETPEALQATVEVFDVRGRRIRTLAADAVGPGRHQVHWDGLDAAGRQVARGIYFVRFKTRSEAWTRKIQVLP